jgi:D-aminoacyl-tRNA deacylase
MRVVIQRVKRAKVKVGGRTVGKINAGLFVLLGIKDEDREEDVLVLADKISKLRIMADSGGKMNLSVKETGSKVLVVSQFTLYADSSKGNRPSFVKAAQPEMALKLYNQLINKLKELGLDVETGVFGKYMNISLFLDGPVTIMLDSRDWN